MKFYGAALFLTVMIMTAGYLRRLCVFRQSGNVTSVYFPFPDHCRGYVEQGGVTKIEDSLHIGSVAVFAADAFTVISYAGVYPYAVFVKYVHAFVPSAYIAYIVGAYEQDQFCVGVSAAEFMQCLDGVQRFL